MDEGRHLGRLTRAVSALAVALAIAVILGICGCGSGAPAQARTTTDRATAAPAAAPAGHVIAVGGATVGKAIPAGFVGISIEEKALEQFAGTNPKALDPAFLHLIQAISPQPGEVLRIGGDSTDWSWWPVAHMAQPPGVKFSLTPGWMSVAHALAADLQARLILGVDLEANSARVADAEARAMVQRIGASSIAGLELGNEPELYGSFGWYRSTTTHLLVPGRPRSWNPSAYAANFAQIAHGLPSAPVAGPSMGGPEWLGDLNSFISAAQGRLRMVTVHAYPLKHCRKATVVTIPQLLAESSSHGLAKRVSPYLAAAGRHHLPLRIDEMNGISCGGTRGVSDTFASALWVLDTLFEMARAGVSGVNVHTVPNTINEVLGPEQIGTQWEMRVHPEYYGMIMFAQAAPAGSRLLRLGAAAPAGVKVWATRSTGGTMHAVVINKRLSGSATISLRVPSATAPATVEQMRAPRVSATSGVTLGGQTFGATTSTGLLAGGSTDTTATPARGAYTVTVPAASATLLTIPKP